MVMVIVEFAVYFLFSFSEIIAVGNTVLLEVGSKHCYYKLKISNLRLCVC